MTDEQIKEQIRAQREKERQQEASQSRWERLHAEVEVEEEWNYWSATTEKEIRLNRMRLWIQEVADGDAVKYLKKLKKWEIPPIHEQVHQGPDYYLYDRADYADLFTEGNRGYWTPEEKEKYIVETERKYNRQKYWTYGILSAIVVGALTIVYFGLLK